MGEVVAFRIREKTSRRASEPSTGDAQILFFLGVRYVRVEESPETRAPMVGRARKRKSRTRLKA